jgi:hypothetical protein
MPDPTVTHDPRGVGGEAQAGQLPVTTQARSSSGLQAECSLSYVSVARASFAITATHHRVRVCRHSNEARRNLQYFTQEHTVGLVTTLLYLVVHSN